MQAFSQLFFAPKTKYFIFLHKIGTSCRKLVILGVARPTPHIIVF